MRAWAIAAARSRVTVLPRPARNRATPRCDSGVAVIADSEISGRIQPRRRLAAPARGDQNTVAISSAGAQQNVSPVPGRVNECGQCKGRAILTESLRGGTGDDERRIRRWWPAAPEVGGESGYQAPADRPGVPGGCGHMFGWRNGFTPQRGGHGQCEASYCAMTVTGMRPRSETGMPCSSAHARISAEFPRSRRRLGAA